MIPSAALTGAIVAILGASAFAAHLVIDVAFRAFGG
jgi:hypothetical protein